MTRQLVTLNVGEFSCPWTARRSLWKVEYAVTTRPADAITVLSVMTPYGVRNYVDGPLFQAQLENWYETREETDDVPTKQASWPPSTTRR